MVAKICVEVLLFEEVSMAAALTTQEFFNIANGVLTRAPHLSDCRFDCQLVQLGEQHWKQGGVQCITKKPARQADVVFLPPAWFDTGRALHAQIERHPEILAWLRQRYAQGSIIASACTGTAWLAASGLLNQTSGTGCWWLANWYQRYTPQARVCLEKLFHIEDRIWTAAAGTAFYNVLLKLVEHFGSHELAAYLGRVTLVTPNDAPQSAFVTTPTVSNVEDAVVAKAQRWIARHEAQPITLDDMAAHCAVSSRTLVRRFKRVLGVPPLTYLQQERITRAKALLASSALALEVIMERVGYSDASSFRKLFRQHTGLTPKAYRERFRVVRNSNSSVQPRRQAA